ncbi:RNA polymerase sigma factor [Dyadobacter beijingensis]|uniref:RNA polymerase sigma factor n=1 Tax=Dyadobacter beijingensis TaxID=365489 RepID=A0ABQ2IFG6_9BACT|nr:RNA polymerase sigma factor [Dyadobacter beijingensis]GGN09566.1 RNA polymerase sigma factor [Dyadobacter beijingensis]
MVEIWKNFCPEYRSTDEELVRLFLESRDNRYFRELYERYALKVYQKCFSLTRNEERAEDIMQDVFVKLVNKMGTFKTGAKFSTWLFTITHNHCLDVARISGRKGIIVTGEVPAIEQGESPVLSALGDDEFDLPALKAALNRLRVEDKAVIYLRYLDDRSIRDIARFCEATESATKMRLLRSRRKLRKWYQKLSGGMDFF